MGELKDNPFTDDDILIEVLQRLPVKSLFDFKCVSKRWYDIISSHYFRKLYQSQRRGAQDDSLSSLLGFFRSAAEGAFIPTSLLVEKPYRKSSSSSIDMVRYSKRDGDFFIGSSNGLLLYHNQYFMAYRISNPVTKRCLFLAQPHSRHVDVAIGFDVKESYDQKCNLGQLKFKLVCLLFPSSKTPFFTLQMKTYSSETRCWRQRNLRVSHGSISFRCFEYAVVINEVFYWLDIMNRIFAYDSNGTQGWEERTIQVIEFPKRSIATTERSFILGESKDGVLQCGRSDSFKIVVWVLKACMSYGGGDQYKWVFRETVSFMLMCHQYPDVMSSCDLILSLEDLRNERNASVPELVAFHPLNPGTVFLRLDKMIISYCLDKGKLKLVQLQGKNYKSGDRSSSSDQDQPWERSNSRLVPYFSPKWASFYL